MGTKYFKKHRKGHDDQEYDGHDKKLLSRKKRVNNNSIMWFCKKWRTTCCNAQVKTTLDRQILH